MLSFYRPNCADLQIQYYTAVWPLCFWRFSWELCRIFLKELTKLLWQNYVGSHDCVKLLCEHWQVEVGRRATATVQQHINRESAVACCKTQFVGFWHFTRWSLYADTCHKTVSAKKQASAIRHRWSWLVSWHSCCYRHYSAPIGEQSIAINLSVCVSVCPRAYLRNHWTNLHEICCADPLWPWLSLPLTALRYVMYFQFYGWRHIRPRG